MNFIVLARFDFFSKRWNSQENFYGKQQMVMMMAQVFLSCVCVTSWRVSKVLNNEPADSVRPQKRFLLYHLRIDFLLNCVGIVVRGAL